MVLLHIYAILAHNVQEYRETGNESEEGDEEESLVETENQVQDKEEDVVVEEEEEPSQPEPTPQATEEPIDLLVSFFVISTTFIFCRIL